MFCIFNDVQHVIVRQTGRNTSIYAATAIIKLFKPITIITVKTQCSTSPEKTLRILKHTIYGVFGKSIVHTESSEKYFMRGCRHSTLCRKENKDDKNPIYPI